MLVLVLVAGGAGGRGGWEDLKNVQDMHFDNAGGWVEGLAGLGSSTAAPQLCNEASRLPGLWAGWEASWRAGLASHAGDS